RRVVDAILGFVSDIARTIFHAASAVFHAIGGVVHAAGHAGEIGIETTRHGTGAAERSAQTAGADAAGQTTRETAASAAAQQLGLRGGLGCEGRGQGGRGEEHGLAHLLSPSKWPAFSRLSKGERVRDAVSSRPPAIFSWLRQRKRRRFGRPPPL